MGNAIGIGNTRGLYTVDCRHEVSESQRCACLTVGDAEGLAVGFLDGKRNRRQERGWRMRITDDYGAGAADYDVTMRSDNINQSSVFPVDKNGR